MSAEFDPELITERLELTAPALGHLLFAAASLEKALLADLLARRGERGGSRRGGFFGSGLVSNLETKLASVLLI